MDVPRYVYLNSPFVEFVEHYMMKSAMQHAWRFSYFLSVSWISVVETEHADSRKRFGAAQVVEQRKFVDDYFFFC